MSRIDNGVYIIISGRGGRQLATTIDKTPGSAVNILPETGNPGEQDWIVEFLPNGNVTIRNLQSRLYLSYDGTPRPNSPIKTFAAKREWRLLGSEEPLKFHVVVPGGSDGDSELAFVVSESGAFPPVTVLLPVKAHEPSFAWKFQLHHESVMRLAGN